MKFDFGENLSELQQEKWLLLKVCSSNQHLGWLDQKLIFILYLFFQNSTRISPF